MIFLVAILALVYFFAWCLCRVAAQADRDMPTLKDTMKRITATAYIDASSTGEVTRTNDETYVDV